MFVESYRYYIKLFGSLKGFDKGLGVLYLPAIFYFGIAGLILLPFTLVKASLKYGKRAKTNNEVVEFIFGTTHQKISSNLKLSNTDKFRFNIHDKDLGLDDLISEKRLFFIASVYGLECSILLVRSIAHVIIRRNSLRLVKSFALAKFAKYHLKSYKVFIQFNDHSPYNVMLQDLAEQSGLKTVYIQHAPVSWRFPPLYHDLNILFSKDSLEKYKFTSGEGFREVKHLVLYDVRFPPKEEILARNPFYTLVCFNKIDNLSEIEKLLVALEIKGIKVKLRPHPEDYRNFNFNTSIPLSRGKTIWDDLRDAHSVIVNESAVALEAIYCDVPVYKLSSLSDVGKDSYGFIETGLLGKEYFSINELLVDLLDKKDVSNPEKLDIFLGNIERRQEMRLKLDIEIENLYQRA